MTDHCHQDGGFIGDAGCTHPNHEHSELVKGIMSSSEPKMISVADADAALQEGFYVDGPDGRVGFGRRLKAHLEQHSAGDAAARKARLEFAIHTVKNPDKIERNHRGVNGRTAYAKAFDDFGILAISDAKSDTMADIFTYIPKGRAKK